MKQIFFSLAALIIFSASNVALADTFTFTAPVTARDNGRAGHGGANQFELDHYQAYTWRIGPVDSAKRNVNLVGMNISSASITFLNISNWDRNDSNRLFVHLLDTAKGNKPGWSKVNDDPNGGGANGTPISDYFITTPSATSAFYADNTGNRLVDAGTDDRRLFDRSFAYDNKRNSQVPSYRHDFGVDDLRALNEFFNAADQALAFGFDADCHFWNNGIEFKINTAAPVINAEPVPEPATMLLLGSGLAGVAAKVRKRRRANKSETAQ